MGKPAKYCQHEVSSAVPLSATVQPLTELRLALASGRSSRRSGRVPGQFRSTTALRLKIYSRRFNRDRMASGWGGRRPGAGRKKGGISQKTRERRELTDEALRAGETPRAYMLSVMRDPNVAAERRDAMAAMAAPYIHPRLAMTALIQDSMEARLARMTREERLARMEELLRPMREFLERQPEENTIEGKVGIISQQPEPAGEAI
jgi:hypothetical protein